MQHNASLFSTDQHGFSTIPSPNIERSTFDRSSNLKTTMDAGYLVPIWVDELLPGDTLEWHATIFGRLSTPLYALMDNLYLDVFAFAVPNRLLWTNWKKFMGEQANPGDSTAYLVPQVESPNGGFAIGSLGDYFGAPAKASAGKTSMAAFWHRGYLAIWNEWFRDQNLDNSITIPLGDGPDSDSAYALLKRRKTHDYFSSSLPFAQKGTAVGLPIGTTAQVLLSTTNFNAGLLKKASDHTNPGGGADEAVGRRAPANTGQMYTSSVLSLVYDPNGTLYADLANATAATINQFRTAFAIQMLYERDARGGTRYTEVIRSQFGVDSPDQRQQRPTYLGGGEIPVSINPIANNNISSGPADVGAFGVVSGQVPRFTYSATEHEVVIVLASLRADINYQNGMPRMFSRQTRLDYYFPALANLGEQAVLSKEIFYDGTGDPVLGTADYSVWGYQERWAEYRYKTSHVTGKFRTIDPLTLDSFHLALNFTTRPALNPTFIEDNPPMSRVLAVTNEPHLLVDAHFSVRHTRPMPVYSVPGLMTRF